MPYLENYRGGRGEGAYNQLDPNINRFGGGYTGTPTNPPVTGGTQPPGQTGVPPGVNVQTGGTPGGGEGITQQPGIEPQTGGGQPPEHMTPNGMGGPGYNFTDDRQREAFDRFFTSPDYQFRLNEGIRNLDSSAASRGMLMSGNQLRDITQYGQGLAAGEYGNYYNRMAGIAGLSQPTDFGGFAGMGAGTMGQLMGARGDLTANLGNISGAGANAQGSIWGNALGGIPWGGLGNSLGKMFG